MHFAWVQLFMMLISLIIKKVEYFLKIMFQNSFIEYEYKYHIK